MTHRHSARTSGFAGNMAKLIWNPRNIRLATALMMFTYLCIVMTYFKYSNFFSLKASRPNPRAAIQKPSTFSGSVCPASISANSITPIRGTRYLMVSAFITDEPNGQVNIITIMNRTHSELFTCIFCCYQHGLSISPVILDKHIDHFGFPFVTTDAFCNIDPTCNATHMTISRPENLLEIQSHLYLPIHKLLTRRRDFDVDFTLCISCLFGGYNNVLQFVQTIETYKLLGVEHVVIYNTSCGPDLDKVLRSYEEDGILEIIPWPIHHFLEPSKGWSYELHSGEVHYYGQQATINDCIHRNRQRSKYVILTDADEIIMPYQHSSLHQLMTELQQNNPNVVAFIFWAHVFSREVNIGSERFNFRQWRHVPGVNILRHISREPLKWWANNNSKMIVDPRKVMQASVHTVFKISGKSIWVPSDLAIVMHTAKPQRPDLGTEKLIMDNQIWEYAERLIPNVNKVLHKSGILK
ncbi:uncharacterized protein LOC113547007 [Pangasianodon hypophthalmus]|uniref:uncharacterized protein LOC113547007 n=1 Tax=Pangasianodon hypophthalmus TaxID=310915 RepID=UPI0023073D96|nr:uncharacterized protein LOC113547007 [Pangasianodon hypophthalmus]XP_026802957.3 uncharacterized protein LOC113547007 [Pangasianodon hypophthalmus]XP_026802958.3 uncharacterized protein LOC113547007 [Pangasianodon hypophthalmus]XP_026802959.3 uncharacterized protein LOC113547007 [Pangasianodon hypophthalmus]